MAILVKPAQHINPINGDAPKKGNVPYASRLEHVAVLFLPKRHIARPNTPY